MSPPQATCTRAIAALGRSKAWREVLDVLATMNEAGPEPNYITYGAAMNACGKGQHWMLVGGLLTQARQKSTEICATSYTAVLGTGGKDRQWCAAIDLLRWAQHQCIELGGRARCSLMQVCRSHDRWSLAVEQMVQASQVAVSLNIVAYGTAIASCSESRQWMWALWMVTALCLAALELSTVACGAAVAACTVETNRSSDPSSDGCSPASWNTATWLLQRAQFARLETNTIASNAVLSSCEAAGRWERALVLTCMSADSGLQMSSVTVSLVTRVLEKCRQWKLAVAGLLSIARYGGKTCITAWNSAAIAGNACGNWGLVLCLLARIGSSGLEPNGVSFQNVLVAWAGQLNWKQSLNVIDTMCGQSINSECLSALPWALATFRCMKPMLLHSIAQTAVASIRAGVTNKPQDLASLAWAFATLAAHDQALLCAITQRALSNGLSWATWRDLSLLAWACVSLSAECEVTQLLKAIRDELSVRMRSLSAERQTRQEMESAAENAFGAMWAVEFSECTLGTGLVRVAQQALTDIGHAFDAAGAPQLAPLQVAHPYGYNKRLLDEPFIVLDLPDRLVIWKPPLWEVSDAVETARVRDLLKYNQAMLPLRRHALMADRKHRCGLLHRLDVPSTGLILVAKTYSAYYELQLQLRIGRISRDYVLLCHGWISPKLHQIVARVDAIQGKQSHAIISTSGRPCRTWLKVLGHATHATAAFGLVATRIGSGRMHQLRAHLSHMQHPIACDSKYSSWATLVSDSELVGRRKNFLHRFCLGFQDGRGRSREAMLPLAPELRDVLLRLAPRCTWSSREFQHWCSGTELQGWQCLERLPRGGHTSTTKS